MLSPYYETLLSIRDKLATIDGIKTCRIGLEHTINAVDYPMIRIVPGIIKLATTQPRREVMEIVVYYGNILHEFEGDGLQEQYRYFLETNKLIRDAISPGTGWAAEWVDTVMDEDRLPGYKLSASRYNVL